MQRGAPICNSSSPPICRPGLQLEVERLAAVEPLAGEPGQKGYMPICNVGSLYATLVPPYMQASSAGAAAFADCEASESMTWALEGYMPICKPRGPICTTVPPYLHHCFPYMQQLFPPICRPRLLEPVQALEAGERRHQPERGLHIGKQRSI